MTEYFEIHWRDGAARIGELRLTESVTTPTLADGVIEDAGSMWFKERDEPEGSEDVVTFPGLSSYFSTSLKNENTASSTAGIAPHVAIRRIAGSTYD